MDEKTKISVVVPVYNVEKFIKKCVDSLINQTYKNIEIILVDDGSTDKSGELCDNYAKQNENIFVLHKPNSGLSDARNYALPYISGRYVAYVDSDDYVDLDFFEKLVKPLNSSKKEIPDMVICTHVNELPDEILLSHTKRKGKYQKLISEKALAMMCYERKFGTSACAKLISYRLVEKFPFPKGKLYEDLATIYKMIGDSNQVVFLNIPMYHYIQRKGSIRNNRWNPSVLDLMEASKSLLRYIDLHYPNIHEAGVQRYFFSANEVYIMAFSEKDYLKLIMPIRENLKKMWGDVKGNPKIYIKQKIRYRMLISCPLIYRKIWRWSYNHKERKNRKFRLLWGKK